MTKVVVGWFEDGSAPHVVSELENAGFARGNIRVRTRKEGGKLDELRALGVPGDEAKIYADELSTRGSLVTVETTDRDAAKAMDIMNRAGARDFGDRIGKLKFAERMAAKRADGETVIPIVEENLEVGKREVETGRVRVHTRVVETPIDKDVVLREEHVRVERRRVDRGADPADVAKAGNITDIELVEHAEQVVVGKTARVVEEVHVSKTIAERTERVHETLRRSEVEVEQYGDRLDRAHYDRFYGKSGVRWENVEPGYRFGNTLGADARLGRRSWASIEADARARWERENPDGGWDRVKEAVRHAYDRARTKYTERHP